MNRNFIKPMSSDYGTYRLTFEPSPGEVTPSVEMTLSGEADLPQMLAFFESFLAASGYVLKGELQVVEPDSDSNLWSLTAQGSQGTDFVPFSMADDVFTLGGK